MIKKLLFSFLVLFSLSNLANAQAVVVTESFDNNPFVPTGWALKPATPQPLWVRSTTSTFPTVTPHSGNAMARFRSRSAIAGLTQQLVTKAIDYSNRGNTATSVSFWIYRDDINANFDSITVYVNNTDSMDVNAVKIGTVARSRTYMIPDTQAVNGWYNYSFAIPTSFNGNMTTHIIFQGNCENILGANQGANTTIDDVSYEEFPMPCSGSPNVGNIVNTTPLICGGSGTSNLSLSTPITGAGITYTWQMSNSFTGPWTIFAGNSATVTTGNLSSKTFIKCIVSCANSGLSYTTNTDSIQVSTNPLPLVLVSPSTAAVCNGATSGAILAATGRVQNPMLEMIYKSPNFRTFQFDFTFYPRDEREALEVQRILERLRFHQAPELMPNAGGFLIPPSEFDIKFYNSGKENPNIPQIATCVLVSLDINYAPNGWAAYETPGENNPSLGRTGMPVSIQATLQFQEMTYLTKADFRSDLANADTLARGN
jgi:hypothetical protein